MCVYGKERGGKAVRSGGGKGRARSVVGPMRAGGSRVFKGTRARCRRVCLECSVSMELGEGTFLNVSRSTIFNLFHLAAHMN